MRSWSMPLLLYLFAALIFSKTRWQLEFMLLMAVSLLTMSLVGQRLLTWAGVMPERGISLIFFKALLGQFMLVVAWLLFSPLTYAWARVLHLPLALPLMVVMVAGMAAWTLARKGWSTNAVEPNGVPVHTWLSSVLGGLVLLKLASYYSMRAGSLGLDTHQHIAFALDMFHAGYPKLSAGSTDWLEKYPKMLHLLASLWAWPGMGGHMGPFLKVQPVLQSTLAVFSLLELVSWWLRRSLIESRLYVAFAIMLSLIWCYVFVRGTAFFYPVMDLNSTGRLAGFGVLLAPTLCALLCWLVPRRATQILAWTLFAFGGAMAAKLNPSLTIGYATYAAPLFMTVMLLPWWRIGSIRERLLLPALGLLFGGALGLLLLLLDPYYVQLLAEVSPKVHRFVQLGLGLRVLETTHDISSVTGMSPERIWEVLLWEFWYGPQPPLWNQWLPAAAQILSGKLLLATRIATVVTLTASLALLVFAPRGLSQRRGILLLFFLQLGALLAAVVALHSSNIISLLLGHETLQASLLSTYTQRYIDLLAMYGVAIHWLLFCTTTVLGCDMVNSVRRGDCVLVMTTPTWVLWGLGVVMLVCAAAFRKIDAPGPAPKSLGWTHPVTEDGVRKFQAAEARLPEDAVILVPAFSTILNGRENWILPAGEVTSYLPFGRRNYLFNVRLGSGYPLQGHDLDAAFCHESPASARELLRQYRVTHIIAIRGTANSPLLNREYCSLSYQELGVLGGEVAEGPEDIVFYRVLP